MSERGERGGEKMQYNSIKAPNECATEFYALVRQMELADARLEGRLEVLFVLMAIAMGLGTLSALATIVIPIFQKLFV